MLVELWHHWLLLRPLLVFLLAGPFVVLALLFRGRGEPQGSQRSAAVLGAVASATGNVRPRPSAMHRVEASPGQRAAEAVSLSKSRLFAPSDADAALAAKSHGATSGKGVLTGS